MIRKYYAQEKPLPADLKAVQRLVGARTKEEREAVDTILNEFFQLEDDGWHNGRCDEELERYLGKTEDRDAKRENEKERQRRHRQRRKELFDALREHGEVPAFDMPTDELVTLLSRVTSRAVTQPVTRDATANQSPVTSHQTPDLKPEASRQASTGVGDDLPTNGSPSQTVARNVAISVLLRGGGIDATSANPIVCLDWAENPKVTDELLGLAIVKARTAKPDTRISVNYLKPIVAELLTAAEAKPKALKENDWEWKRSDAGIVNKGRELGMFARGGENHRDFAVRIDAEIAKRKGQKP